MKHLQLRVTATVACAFTLMVLAGAPDGVASAAASGADGQSVRAAQIVAYWTAERRAAAQPRDLLLDSQGRAYLRLGNGALLPYGRELAGGPGTMVPNAKPGSRGGGSGDTVFPVVGSMNPAAGATIGYAYTFSATVTDNVGLRSVTFSVRKGSSRTQSFSASPSGDTWTVSLSGFSDGDWSWYVVAKDTSGNTTTSTTVAFKVDTSSGGGGSSGGDVVTNAEWPGGDTVQKAAGRIYFEMPSNAKRTRWAGYVCSGTVVTDGTTGRSVILTAAHCVYDDSNKAFARNVLFIPDQAGTTGSGTDLNCSNDPMGCWTPSFGVVDVNWTTRTFPDNIAWDYAYYVVPDSGAHSGTSASSEKLDVAAGSMPLSFALPAHDDSGTGSSSPDYTRALGYSYSDDPNFMYCAEDMTTEGTANWWLPSCGLSGGASGGPWLQDASGTGYVVMSVNSWGYTTSPGMAGPMLSGTSAYCVFGLAKTFAFESVSGTDGDAGETASCGN